VLGEQKPMADSDKMENIIFSQKENQPNWLKFPLETKTWESCTWVQGNHHQATT
jgi:hypothetical protein